jgi:hypothetical protein
MLSSFINLKKSTKISIIFVIFSIGGILSFIAIHSLMFSNHAKEMALNNAIKKSKERESFIKAFVQNSTDEINAIKNSSIFTKYLLEDNNTTNDIESLLITIASSNRDIAGIRYISHTGIEKIRVHRDRPSREPYLIAENMLQNKSDRYYFKDSKDKPLDEIWFSALDLTFDRGSLVIPFKPTLRAILPISKDNRLDGILVINYFMKEFLRKLTNTPLYDMILIDHKGFPLYHYNTSKSWGEHITPTYNIKLDFKNHTDNILTKEIYQTKNFVSRGLDLPFAEKLILVLQLKEKYIIEQNSSRIYQYIVVSSTLLILAIIVSLMLPIILKKIKREEKAN